MNVSGIGHLSYCTNIHPGESWDDVFRQLQLNLPAIKRRLSPQAPFGVGLRLSAEAAATLTANSRLAEFRQWLDSESLYVFTLNGFPYGDFHGRPVKEAVYRPDWSQADRLQYTIRLARILAALLPPGVEGSISTVPGAFKADITDPDYRGRIISNLVAAAAELYRQHRTSGHLIRLALEPEPACMLETAAETAAFFQHELFSDASARELAGILAEPPEQCGRILREHLGVCLDTCHAAVMFEEPLTTARELLAAGIPIAKLQLTAALAVDEAGPDTLAALRHFCDPVYLHQTTVVAEGKKHCYLDLPEALANHPLPAAGQRWRCHFHVPVFMEKLGLFNSTAPALSRLLDQHRRTPFCAHMEVETYTIDVLPAEHRQHSVAANIERELAWVLARLRV